MHLRWPVAIAAFLGALTATGRASASEEAHQTAGDVDIHLDPAGMASLHEAARWHVVRGPVHWIDLGNIEPTAVPDPVVPISAEDGRSLVAHVERRDAHTLRITVDEPKALMRGDFTFDVRWRVDWVKSGAIARDGAAWRLCWSSPYPSDGLDLVRTTIDLPAAREAPAVILADNGAIDDSALSSVRREPERDVLQMVRPHLGRGESIAWTVRVDPGALPAVADPRLRAPPPLPPPEADRVHEVSAAGALVTLALAFGVLVAAKARAFAAACAARGVRARSVVGLPDGMRALVAGLGFAAGLGLQGLGSLTGGSLLVAFAILAAASRAPKLRPPARGPGRWLVLKPEEAFVSSEDAGHWLDAGTRSGQRTAWVAGALVIMAALAARRLGPQGPWLVVLDAVVLVPLLATGRSTDLLPGGACAASPWLASVFDRLRAVASLRVAPWARVVLGGSTVDEVRLLVLPRAVMPGVVGIEVGRAWSTTPTGWAATPEVLVRVLEGSSAAVKLTQVLPRVRSLPGRRGDERVVRVRPRAGTRAGTAALTRGLAEALTDRRAAAPARPWEGPTERRKARAAPPAATPMAAAKAC